MHLGDDAELYALGLLPLENRPQIEAHLRECDLCRRRVVEAEETAWRLSATLDAGAQPKRPRTVRTAPVAWATGLAAAFALAFGVQSVRLAQADASIGQTGAALAVVAASHFDHLTMTPAHGSLVAKVIYAKDRRWIYCIAEAHTRFRVSGLSAGVWRTLAQTSPGGAVSTAFASSDTPLDEVTLSDGETIAAKARLRSP